MKKITLIVSALFLSLPSLAFAHEKWFVEVPPQGMVVPDIFTRLQFTNLLMIGTAVVALLFALVLNRRLAKSKLVEKAHKDIDRVAAWGVPIVRLTTGLLMFTASFIGFFFAPDLSADNIDPFLAVPLLYAQAAIGLMLVLGLVPRLNAFFGLALFLLVFAFFPQKTDVLPYVLYAGIFLYLIILGDASVPKVKNHKTHFILFKSWLEKLQPFALDILRVGLAVSLIIPALFYKILYPQFALTFIEMQPLNFMQGLGFVNFSDAMFVLAAGLVEILLGVFLMFNILPRFIGAVLIFVFTVTLGMLGIFELLGHLPLYGAAYAILVQAKKANA